MLTTFVTPFGRYHFNRLPFGITSAPEVFQKQMSQALDGLDGVVCLMDDILVYGSNQEEHDARLLAVLNRLRETGITLNGNKCQFSKKSVKFLGHVLSGDGIASDPDKVAAIQKIKDPTDKSAIRRFLGMANQLSKFVANLADITEPLRALLSEKTQWTWTEQHSQAIDQVKKELSGAPVLALYNPTKETVVSSDASSFGLGAVIKQKQPNGVWKPIAYASRSLTPTEKRYAQIEKETLAATWASERFHTYLMGKEYTLIADHKPLVALLSNKNLEDLPPRILRFRLRLMRYNYNVQFLPGKEIYTADALSRSPVSEPSQEDESIQETAELFVEQVISHLPASDPRLEQIRRQQQDDDICRQIRQYVHEGWPENGKLKGEIRLYASMSAEITIQRDLLLRGNRLIIPQAMRKDILQRLHDGHLGITKCRERARQSVWWPGLNRHLQDLLYQCRICSRDKANGAEPLIPTQLPHLPWQKVATDLFDFKGTPYLLIVDYFSRYIEIAQLKGTTAKDVVNHAKSVFSRHGIPEVVVSDNGPQYSSLEFANFAKEYGFQHITSSPRYPQVNGEAERAVQTVKCLLRKASDPYLALLAYRTSPLSNGYSPAELLMARRLRTTVPLTRLVRKPVLPNLAALTSKEDALKASQKKDFDKRHAARALPPLSEGDQVWIPDREEAGKVIQETQPRSYLVNTSHGLFRRNRRQLNWEQSLEDDCEDDEGEDTPESPQEDLNSSGKLTTDHADTTSSTNGNTPRPVTTTRSERQVQPPKRLDL